MPRWWDEYVERAWSAGFLAEQQLIPPADRVPILYFSTPAIPGRPPSSAVDFNISREQLSDWLREHSPEVVLSYGPFIKPTLAELGISIPKDLAFVETFLENPDGTTAGVHQNCHRVGELSVEVLASQLHQHIFGVPSIPTATLVEGAWCDGASLPERKNTDVVKIPEVANHAFPTAKSTRYFSRTRNYPRKVAV
jgi:LacI family transcriptional regulator